MATFDDDDFDDLLGDIDFDGGSKKQAKSKHGVVFSTGIDVAKGIGDSIIGDPLSKVGDIAREIMPSSVRYEYGELESAVSEVKEEISKGIDDVKKLGKQFAKVSSGLLPEGSKLQKLLKDIGSGDDANKEREKSKEEQEQDKINAAILEALGQSDKKQANETLLKEVMESKREASSQQVLKSIFGELKLSNNFNNEVVYKFYSKSLELQYKQLYKMAELVELTKYSWEIQRKQTESIVNNVALPDIIKLRALEAMKDRRLRASSAGSMFSKYYQNFDPFANLKKNIVGNVRNRISGLTQGLQAAISGAESMQSMKEMMAGMGDMPGMSKGFVLGNMIGDWVRAKTLGNLGDRLGKTNMGRKFVFNFKDAFADPRAFFKNLDNKEKGNTLTSKWKKRLFGGIASLTGTPSRNTMEFVNENLDDARSFDGRAHQAIVKVIPGLLSRIYGAIKTGLKVDDSDVEKNTLYYDNKTGSFMTADRLRATIRKDMKSTVNNDGLKSALESFLRLYSDVGIDFNKNEKKAVALGVSRYMMNRNSSVNSSTIVSDGFIKAIGGKVADKVRKGGVELIKQSKRDPYIQDNISSSLTNIRKSLPNMDNRLQDLHRSGYMDIAGSMRLVDQNAITGDWSKNDRNNDRLIASAVRNIDFDSSSLQWEDKFRDRYDAEQAELKSDLKETGDLIVGTVKNSTIGSMGIKAVNKLSNTRTGKRVSKVLSSGKSAAQKAASKAKRAKDKAEGALINALNQEPQAVIEQIQHGKVKVQELLKPEKLRTYPKQAVNKLQLTYNQSQNKVKETVKVIEAKIMDGSLSEDAREKFKLAKKEIDKITSDFVEDCRDFGITEKSITDYKQKVESVSKEVADQVKGKVRSSSTLKRFMGSKYGNFVKKGVGNIANLYTGGITGKAKEVLNKSIASKDNITGKAKSLVGKGVTSAAKLAGKGVLGTAKLAAKLALGSAKLAGKLALGAGKLVGKGALGGAKLVGKVAAGAKGMLAGVKENGLVSTISGQSKRFKEYLISKKEDMQREGSWRNRLKKFLPVLQDGEKKGKLKSLFSAKTMVKGLAMGSVGILAISLIKKLGITMEDVVSFGKSTINAIKDVGGMVGSALGVIVPVISGIGGAISKFLNFLGIGDGEGGAGGLGTIAGTALGLWATNKLMFGIPGKIAKFGFKAGKLGAKLLFGKGALGVGKLAGKGALGAGKLALGGATLVGKGVLGAGKLALGAGTLVGGTIVNAGTKAASGVKSFLSSGIDKLSGLWDKTKSVGTKVMDKMPTPSKIRAKLNGSLKELSSVADKKLGKNGGKLVLGRIAKKIGVRLSAIASGAAVAATGIGAIVGALITAISTAMFVYDVYSIGRLMWQGHKLSAALSIHYLGVDITDSNVKDIPTSPEDKEIMAEIAHAENEAKANKEGGAKKEIKQVESELAKEPTSTPTNYSTSNITNTTNNKTIQNQSVSTKPFIPPKSFKYTGIGSVSGWFEARNNPATVSTGAGDFGGVSYGTWQLASKTGTLTRYLKYSKYGSELSKFTPGTNAFNSKWKEIAARDPEGFQKDQEDFIKKTHYTPCVTKLKEIGLDVNARSDAVKSMVFSTAVSLGAYGAYKSIKKAIETSGLNPATASDEELINAVYDYKADTVSSMYRSSSYGVQQARRNRAMNEKAMVLNILKNNPSSKVASETIKDDKSSTTKPNEVAKEASAVVKQEVTKESTMFDISGTRGKTIWNRETGEIKYTDKENGDYRIITLGPDGTLRSNVPRGDTLPTELHKLAKSINSGKGYYADVAKAMQELGLIGHEKKPLSDVSTSTTSEPKVTNPIAQPVAYTPTKTPQPQAQSSGGKIAAPKISMGGVEDILKQQLMVQVQMLNKLTDIVTNTNIFAELSKNKLNKEQDGPTMTPQPAISLERNENFSHVMGSNQTTSA